MKLFLISQTTNNNYDTFDSAVVVAADEQSAKQIHPNESWTAVDGTWCNSPDLVTAVYVGIASDDLVAGDIICTSFNAG